MTYRKGEPLPETVLTELCTEYGICLGPDDRSALIEMPRDDLDTWTREVFKREGLNEANRSDELWRQVRAHVGRRFLTE